MEDSEIRTRLDRIVMTHLGLEAGPADNSTWEDMGADSLDSVELAMIVEEEFGIEISDEEGSGWGTFGMMVRGVIALVRNRG